MTSSEKRNKSTLFDEDDVDRDRTKKAVQIRVNDIPDIDKYVLNLTWEKLHDIIKLFLQVADGIVNVSNIEEKLKVISNDCPPLMYKHVIYDLYYDDNNLLKKYFFIFLSIFVNKHYHFIEENTKLDNINLCIFLRLIDKYNSIHKI
ncbi:unnamed protein product [Rotaria sp. Silwood2]|nr:unnamed protein product [Rotaria sp. Silwood2]CAF4738294.1 unnamed protein product [Rotaria sp. Silwood2]